MTAPTSASGTPQSFSCTVTVRATRSALWRVWTDVPNWPAWDTPLRQAVSEGPLQLGSVGSVTDQRGRTSRFSVTAYQPEEAYAFATALPGGALTVRRFVSAEHPGGVLEITHHVQFSGPLRRVWAAVLGRGFMRQLGPVMANLARRAEGV